MLTLICPVIAISIHALLAESDWSNRPVTMHTWRFLSTLSLRRATQAQSLKVAALRNFYPRSPCGERQHISKPLQWTILFLSTLSLRRATREPTALRTPHQRFLSTLSLRRATLNRPPPLTSRTISIHALLAESDACTMTTTICTVLFLSTLSLRRATQTKQTCRVKISISIHALLAESDARKTSIAGRITSISIHALLAESDSKSAQNSGALLRIWNKFYGDCIFMLTGKAVFYPFCPCFFHIFWCEGTGNFMIAFPSH